MLQLNAPKATMVLLIALGAVILLTGLFMLAGGSYLVTLGGDGISRSQGLG